MRPALAPTALALALALAPAALRADDPPAPPAAAPPKTVAGVTFTPAAGWVEEAASGMRAAQYRVPRPEGVADEASVVVYYFNGQGGSVEDNVARWCGQFQRPDGKPAREAAKVERKDVGGLEVHLVEVDGTYVAETRPGSGERVRKEGWRLLGAIVVTPKAGPFFVKFVGPEASVAAAREAFTRFIESFRQG